MELMRVGSLRYIVTIRICTFIREKKKGFCIYGCTAVKCKGIRGLTRDRLISSVVHMRVCMYDSTVRHMFGSRKG